MNRIAKCCLCSQIAGEAENDLIARMRPGRPYERRVILESPAFALVPSLGPLVPGHVLLCPKQHVKSFALLESSLAQEYQEIKEITIRLLREQYGGEVHLFEHGMSKKSGRHLCTVSHAHLHLLPLPEYINSISLPEGQASYDGSLEMLGKLAYNKEYILYESPEAGRFIFLDEESSLESQYMRKVIAKALGNEAIWNWRDFPNARLTDMTWAQLSHLVASRPHIMAA